MSFHLLSNSIINFLYFRTSRLYIDVTASNPEAQTAPASYPTARPHSTRPAPIPSRPSTPTSSLHIKLTQIIKPCEDYYFKTKLMSDHA